MYRQTSNMGTVLPPAGRHAAKTAGRSETMTLLESYAAEQSTPVSMWLSADLACQIVHACCAGIHIWGTTSHCLNALPQELK